MTCFSKVLTNNEEFKSLAGSINTLNAPVGAIGVADINKVHLVHSLCAETGKKGFIITPDEASAVRFYEDLAQMQKGVLLYPKREFTFLEVEGISREFEQIRLGVLSKIVKGNYSAVVMSAAAAVQLTMPPDALKSRTFSITTGDEIDIDAAVDSLIKAGYTRFDQVDGTSQFAVRGGLIDIFPPGADEPVRIELWGDTVDSITHFDIATQRRNKMVDSVEIIPSTEVLFENRTKQAKAIRTLAESLKGKAVKAREKLYADCDKLEQGVSLHCNDKYLPLAYDSRGIFDYLEGILFVCESAKVKEKTTNAQKLLNEEIKWLLDDGVLCKGIDKFALDFDDLTA